MDSRFRIETGTPQAKLEGIVGSSVNGGNPPAPLPLLASIIDPSGTPSVAGVGTAGGASGGNPNTQTWTFDWANAVAAACDHTLRVEVAPPGTDSKDYELDIVASYASMECNGMTPPLTTMAQPAAPPRRGQKKVGIPVPEQWFNTSSIQIAGVTALGRLANRKFEIVVTSHGFGPVTGFAILGTAPGGIFTPTVPVVVALPGSIDILHEENRLAVYRLKFDLPIATFAASSFINIRVRSVKSFRWLSANQPVVRSKHADVVVQLPA